VTITPRGFEVEPDVYCRNATSAASGMSRAIRALDTVASSLFSHGTSASSGTSVATISRLAKTLPGATTSENRALAATPRSRAITRSALLPAGG
jgi:hypothetical protein